MGERIADWDSRLAKYRAALDAGADAEVAGSMAEVQGERLRAELDLGTTGSGEKMTKAQVRACVLALHDIASLLTTADSKLKAEVSAELGVSVAYDHKKRRWSESKCGRPLAFSQGGVQTDVSTPPVDRPSFWERSVIRAA